MAGGGDGELAVLDALGGDQLVGKLFDFGCLAADGEDFKTVVVVEMAMQGGDDDLAVFVLEISEQILKMMPVMVVHDRDGAGDFAGALLLLMLDKLGADHVGDGQ